MRRSPRARTLLCPAIPAAAVALSLLCGTAPQPPAPTAGAPAHATSKKSDADRFVSVEALNELALSFPRPPADVAEFDLAVTFLLKDLAADWPRAAERARESAPNDAYSTGGLGFLTLVDNTLAAEAAAAPTLEDRAALCRARYPATCALLDRAARDLGTSKYKPFPRPRPTGDRKDSYPSGHAALAAMECRLLWEVVRDSRPQSEDTLLREAYARAFDRVVLTVHHPTDVAAGVAFGFAAAGIIIKTDAPAFRESLDAARKEW